MNKKKYSSYSYIVSFAFCKNLIYFLFLLFFINIYESAGCLTKYVIYQKIQVEN